MYQELLSATDIEQIHETSMKLLAEVGVDFACEEALLAFQDSASGLMAAASTSLKTAYEGTGNCAEAVHYPRTQP